MGLIAGEDDGEKEIKSSQTPVSYTHLDAYKRQFVVLNLIEEISKPITLAMRLFGNILAGEILLEILNNLAPWLVPIVWIAFSLFVGVIQAYIFTTLVSVYMKESV